MVLVVGLYGFYRACGSAYSSYGRIGVAVDARRTGVPSTRTAPLVALALPASALCTYVVLPAVGLGAVAVTPLWSGLRWFLGPFGLLWLYLGYVLWRVDDPGARERSPTTRA